MDLEEKIRQAIENTEVIKPPKKLLASFDSTTIHYYMLAVPMYLDFEGMDIVSGSLELVAKNIAGDIEKKKDPYSAIIKGIDEFWDVSLSKFIQDIISESAYHSHIPDLLRKSTVRVG